MSDDDIKVAAHQKHRRCHWCIECRQVWPCLTRRLAAALAASQALAELRSLALATMREALERSAAFWRPVAADLEHGILSVDSVRFLAQDYLSAIQPVLVQPADDAAEQAGAVLEAGQAARDALLASRFPAGDTPDEIDAQAKAAIDGWDRARSALRGHGAVEG